MLDEKIKTSHQFMTKMCAGQNFFSMPLLQHVSGKSSQEREICSKLQAEIDGSKATQDSISLQLAAGDLGFGSQLQKKFWGTLKTIPDKQGKLRTV